MKPWTVAGLAEERQCVGSRAAKPQVVLAGRGLDQESTGAFRRSWFRHSHQDPLLSDGRQSQNEFRRFLGGRRHFLRQRQLL